MNELRITMSNGVVRQKFYRVNEYYQGDKTYSYTLENINEAIGCIESIMSGYRKKENPERYSVSMYVFFK